MQVKTHADAVHFFGRACGEKFPDLAESIERTLTDWSGRRLITRQQTVEAEVKLLEAEGAEIDKFLAMQRKAEETALQIYRQLSASMDRTDCLSVLSKWKCADWRPTLMTNASLPIALPA